MKDFGTIKEGDLGGFVHSEENLSQYGDAWVCGDARVYGDAQVCGDARVYGDAWVWFDISITFLSIGPLGACQRNITITPIEVAAGCFQGSHADFWKAVQEKYGNDGGDYARIKSLLNLETTEP